MAITPQVRALAAGIRLAVFDVDGVLTDGRLIRGDDGQEYKAFHSRDGLGLRMLQDSGVAVAIITGRESQVVAHRAQELGIAWLYQGRRDKLPALEELSRDSGLAPAQMAYIGDDVVDLPVMRRVALAVAVADAHPLVHERAHWSTSRPGGLGAAREVCELLMEAQNTLDGAMARYLV